MKREKQARLKYYDLRAQGDFVFIFYDFDENNGLFYNNLWMDEEKLVIKMPINDKESCNDFKIEEFDLARYKYLLNY